MGSKSPGVETPRFIEQKCSECGGVLRIPVEFAGKFGKCRHCGATILAEHASTLMKPVVVNEPRARMVSLDVLRGFDMFWIIGADALFQALMKAGGGDAAPPFIKAAATQLEHVPWKGFHFYDLIFPLFIFMVGMAAFLSIGRIIERDGRPAAIKRIVRRAALLFVLGALYDIIDSAYSGGGAAIADENLLCGVLQRIALCYLVTGLLLCTFEWRGLVAAFVVLFVGYWAVLSFIPAPGEAGVVFERGRNIIHYIDKQIPPYYDIDPEGLASTFGAICSCLLGVFAAYFVTESSQSETEQATWLFVVGAAIVIIGFVWSVQMPVIKRLWTPSYVMVAGGYSIMLLGLFIWIVDVMEWRWWIAPFLWIGSNSIAVYFFHNLVRPGAWLQIVSGASLGGGGEAAMSLVGLGLSIAFVYVLYKKEIYIRV